MEGKKVINAVTVAMVVVIFAVIGALIVGSVLNLSIFDNVISSGSVTNESLGAVDNVSNTTLAIKSSISNAICSLTTLYNSTGGETLSSGNYTFYTTACNLILNSSSSYINESLNATYTYTYDTNRSIGGINVAQITNDFSAFITGLLAFLAIIGVIVGVVWLVFYVRSLFDKKTGLPGISA